MMRATVQLGRPTVLVVHDDGEALDVLTQLFEASGFDIVTAVTGFRAQSLLESDRKIDVIVAPWDLEHPLGGEVYRWALQRRYDLRDQFVFLAAEVPPDFDRLVAGRCLAISMLPPGEVVRVALATIRRVETLELMRDAALAHDGDKPTLLLCEDERVLLAVMADLLSEAGYAVKQVESGNAAIASLDIQDFDAIIVDWHMDDGTGADVFRWLTSRKPYLANRVIFLTNDETEDTASVAPGRPMLRKGQDSASLLRVLQEIVREVRGGSEDKPSEEAFESNTVAENNVPGLDEETEVKKQDNSTMQIDVDSGVVISIEPDDQE